MLPIGPNLYHLRQFLRLDAVKVAEATGLDVRHLLEVEAGTHSPTLAECIRLSDFFRVPVDHLLRYNLTPRRQVDLPYLKMLALDIDGVQTDGGMYFSESGDETKKFNAKDGRAILNLVRKGWHVAFLSSGMQGKAIRARAERLGVQQVYVGKDDKLGVLRGFCEDLGLSVDQVAYIGDDVNDLSMIGACGFTACPADAAAAVKAAVDVVLLAQGGHGCVREFVETWLRVEVEY
jgi:YrbI family 3-deoxy-D-manno-octulosonate 8-phosphate phosphatase